jgi:hypothetical protein
VVSAAKSLPSGKQHVVSRWRSAMFSLLARPEDSPGETQIRRIRTGPVEAHLCFAYDLFWLQIGHKLPGRLIDPLKERSTFQSARYEVLIAAIFARAGFNIEWFDVFRGQKNTVSSSLFTRSAKTKIAVEARSRLRSGPYHFPGPISTEKSTSCRSPYARRRQMPLSCKSSCSL